MGSRYGSLKQVDRFGPSGQTLLEYSLYDALKAGFGKAVFIVRHYFADDFKKIILKRALKKADISLVCQELENLPPGFSVPPGRKKPWGTGHAVMLAEEEIDNPFAVINADDFYGADSYRIMVDFLSGKTANGPDEYCLIDYQLDNTLSESGAVSRGVCKVDGQGYLTDITEHKKICRNGNLISGVAEGQNQVILTGKEPVSMNLMGFRPSIFGHLRNQFSIFLQGNLNNHDTEFYLPFAMNEVIKSGAARVRVLHTHEKWFGVTYREDRNMVMKNLKDLVAQGAYPSDLWK
jgi:NDP-sugar pyrophosphorylase family protein